MEKTVINSYDEFATYIGKPLGTSDWIEVDQNRINAFADATLDHQWIHVDVERAKKESPYKSTIAHGYLTLSLLPHLWDQIVEVNNLKMMVNYGMDKMRFGIPVITARSQRCNAKHRHQHIFENLFHCCVIKFNFIFDKYNRFW